MAGEAAAKEATAMGDPLGYYACLNVACDASQEEVRRAYRELVKAYHPDKIRNAKTNPQEEEQSTSSSKPPGSRSKPTGSEASEGSGSRSDVLESAARAGFSRIHAAYETLSDPSAREIYDTYGAEGLHASRDIVPVDDDGMGMHDPVDGIHPGGVGGGTGNLRRLKEELARRRMREEVMRELQAQGFTGGIGGSPVHYRGTYAFSVSAVDALRPWGDGTPVWSPWRRLSGVHLRSLAISSQVSARLSDIDTVALAGSAATGIVSASPSSSPSRPVAGGGSLALNGRRQTSAVSSLDYSMSIGSGAGGSEAVAAVSVQSTRQLSKDDGAAIGLTYHTRTGTGSTGSTDSGSGELGLTLTSTRKLGKHAMGEATLSLGPASPSIHVAVSRRAPKHALALDVRVGRHVLGLDGSATRVLVTGRKGDGNGKGEGKQSEDGKHGEEDGNGGALLAKAAFKLGTHGLEFELGGAKVVSENLNVSMATAVGIQGVFWRLRCNHNGHRIVMPVCLATSVTLAGAVSALVGPPAFAWVLTKTGGGPVTRWYRRLVSSQRDEEKQARLEARMHATAGDVALMVAPAFRKRKAGHARGGLVIVRAVYGDIDAFRKHSPPDWRTPSASVASAGGEGASSGSHSYHPKRLGSDYLWIDVTIPVQFFCGKDDKLCLHDGIPKSNLMGFCKTASDRGNKLLVRYLYDSKPHEALVSDAGGLVVPSERHLMVTNEPTDGEGESSDAVASSFAKRASELAQERADDVIADLLA